MQRPCSNLSGIRHQHWAIQACRVLSVVLLLPLTGCPSGTPPTAPSVSTKPFASVKLVVACSDPHFVRQLTDRSSSWAGKTGASVRIESGRVESKAPQDVPQADLIVVHANELGGLAVKAELVAVPAPLKANNHPLQRARIVEIYRDTLPAWGSDVQGLPLFGDGFLVVYRADRFAEEKHRAGFNKKYSRPLDAPTTWEDIAEIATYFAEADGKPSLPPVPNQPGRLLTQFHQIAACYDRKARSESNTNQKQDDGSAQTPAFQFQSGTWQPRIDSPSFKAAAGWLNQTHTLRMPSKPGEVDNPVAAIDTGSAVIAVLTLAEVAQLPKDPATGAVSSRFQIAAMPGTRTYFNAAGKPEKTVGTGNYIPYLGSRTLIGAVRQASPNQDAAWDLLADLASPTTSITMLNDPVTGSGPFRREHVDQGRDPWLVYNFDPIRHQRFADAMRSYVALNVSNPTVVVRTPDQAALMAALEANVRRTAMGQQPPAEAMQQAANEWKALDAKQNPEELVKWRRNSVGLP